VVAILQFSLVEEEEAAEEERGVQRVSLVKASLLNLLQHISTWLSLFAFVCQAVLFKHSCFMAQAFFLSSSSSPLDCFFLLLVHSFDLPSLSFLHTTHRQRSISLS
jgi:hypothetical protein